ncbi:hypothetical protein FHW19_004471 [Ochrobactrum anthropi]|uniref:hypothetical protein n=1 Tax=Brucella anthropi TaxID=529 RepID=UPI0015F8EB04|nr:hypothetical protein [Brucella anthropi]MBA8862720.1 hypothetical protein [Brucella anthropi]
MSGYKSEKAIAPRGGKLWEHSCDAKGCNAWGSFGYKTAHGQLWFCREHKQEGEDALAGRR